MSTTFERAIALTKTEADSTRYTWSVPDGWQQGRGAFGGLVLGGMTRALQGQVEPERLLRSLTGTICGPLLHAEQGGEATLSLDLLRQGSNTSTWSARLEQGDEVQAHAVGLFGSPRALEGGDWNDLEAPAAEAWEELPVLPILPPASPVFAQHFDFRSSHAIPFMSMSQERATSGWIRLKAPPARLDAATIVAMMDAWWPSLLVTLDRMRPIATVSFTLELLADPAQLDPQVPLRYRSRHLAASQGYTVEFRELWTATGELVALNQQSIAIIK